jgi:rare lipoprotein A (peptidoglycan hydrolase)
LPLNDLSLSVSNQRRKVHRNKKIASGIVLTGIGLMAFAFVDAAEGEVLASWYGSELAGSPTACTGTPYNPGGLTAAHKTLPCGSRLLVKHEGRGVAVTVNDRGPHIPGRDLDLSAGAARVLGIDGVAAVEVERVDSPTPTTEAPELPKELPATGGLR